MHHQRGCVGSIFFQHEFLAEHAAMRVDEFIDFHLHGAIAFTQDSSGARAGKHALQIQHLNETLCKQCSE